MQPWLLLLVLTSILTACSTSPTGRSQLMIVSPKSAIVESEKAYMSTMHELDTNKKLLTDPAWVNRIRSISGRLISEAVVKYPESKDWRWSVAIIDDPETLNAWCMAGGRMAIYSGIVIQLELSDDEIAQIMGHEIAHALANHTAERMSRATLMNAGLAVTAQAVEGNQIALGSAAMAAKLALELPNSRTAESEADRIGIELAARAGYAPEAAVSLWKKMESAGGGGAPAFLSTHPSPSNRASELAKLGPEMRALNPTMKKSNVHVVKIVTSSSEL